MSQSIKWWQGMVFTLVGLLMGSFGMSVSVFSNSVNSRELDSKVNEKVTIAMDTVLRPLNNKLDLISAKQDTLSTRDSIILSNKFRFVVQPYYGER